MPAIDWSTIKPAVDPATQPWVKTEPVWCPDCRSGGRDVQHFAKSVRLINGGSVGDLACEMQCDPECRYYNEDFQRQYQPGKVWQTTFERWGLIT